MEYRSVLTSAPEANNGMLSGMVTPFNTWTPIGDVNSTGFYERVAPGAFANTLLKGDVAFLFNHDSSMPLARSSVPNGAGSLSLYESPDMGLMMRAAPVQTSYGQDLIELTRTGVVNGMSFGFEVVRDAWTDDQGNKSSPMNGTHRTLLEVRLFEVSAVTFPAYPTTSLAAS